MEKFHEAKDLDVTFAGKGVWLVKVPKYMSDCWKTAQPGGEIGKLIIAKAKPQPGKQQEAIFSLNERLAAESAKKEDNEKLTEDHSFNLMGVKNQSLSVLSVEMLPPTDSAEAAAGTAVLPFTEGKVAIEGRVLHRAECRPRINTGYMKHIRNRVELGNKPKREIIQLDKAVISYKPVSHHEADIAYEMRKKEEGKKTRDEAHVVQQALFGAFEKHQYYNIKDLVSITKQPIAYLKEILKEICTYNLKAPHKNMWELKPEYRHYGRDASSN